MRETPREVLEGSYRNDHKRKVRIITSKKAEVTAELCITLNKILGECSCGHTDWRPTPTRHAICRNCGDAVKLSELEDAEC